ncbi:MAG: pyridoxal-phosphate dependent enzyme [Polyangiales bacterium]
MTLGAYPTPVVRLRSVERACGLTDGVALWCKRDDRTGGAYGGNKVRKLEHLLVEARAQGASRLVTVGAVGSHHVLATALYGIRAGFVVEAVLTPQPWTPHVEEVARVDASLGLVAIPARSYASVPLAVARRLRARDGASAYFVPPGGSSVTGSLGYVEAADELAHQLERGDCPKPASIVVALGSGGTAAGLLVGLHRRGLLVGRGGEPGIELVAVQVVDPPLASATGTLALALAIERRLGGRLSRSTIAALSRGLRVVRTQLGAGYGHGTATGDAATTLAADDALTLDPTYTGKAFAGALDEVRRRGPGEVVLYWHTLAAPEGLAELVAVAPAVGTLAPAVRALMVGAPPLG